VAVKYVSLALARVFADRRIVIAALVGIALLLPLSGAGRAGVTTGDRVSGFVKADATADDRQGHG
jgi:hypothetical protein